MLRTRFTDMFGLRYPVMSAPMTLHSGATLAAAVSRAGGLGSIPGFHTSLEPDWLRREVAAVRARTDKPFAIGFISDLIPFAEALFETALASKPSLVALSFGDPSPWISRCRDVGVRVACQAQTHADAERAVGAGAHLLVAQGNEAGGHTGTMGLLPLLSGMVANHPQVPVLAAGGIADGTTLASALMAGAEGAWLGTSLLATPEAVEIDDDYKSFIVASDGSDTVFTRAYDILSPFPWPKNIGERVRRNAFTDHWIDRQAELEERHGEVAQARTSADSHPALDENREILYGQSARSVTGIRPAAHVIRTICEEAEARLRSRPTEVLG